MTEHDTTFDARSWQRARLLFEQWADLPATEQEERLQQLQEDQPDLLPLLRHLLANDSTSDDFLETPILPSAAEDEPGVDWSGQRLGPYRLQRAVGRGGAGIVYLAQREDADFEQQVAIKILHRTLHDDARRRFRLERRILARLQHPAIARLIDGGSTQDGQPYVVMEWVDGEPITAYCQRHQLDLLPRLQLFRQAVEGVLHAHRHLVVHRDLKPSNILVNREGKAKLLDFGIAKLLASKTADSTWDDHAILPTQESRWLSPGYASPEQVLGEPISPASDVYSLGLLLYELLVGVSPQPKSPTELVRFVNEGHLPAPSQYDGATLPFRRRLRGDLDAIVVQATERDPQQRYGSIEALLNDLDRYLSGRPVEARRAGSWYRLQKFARRHLAATVASGLLAVVVLSFTLYTALQTQRLAQERDQTELRRVAAETLSDILVETLHMLDPASGRERDARTKAVLDQGRSYIQQRFVDQPDIEAELLLSLGSIYRRLAHHEESEELLNRTLQLSQPDDAIDFRDAQQRRQRRLKAESEMGRLLTDRGDLETAETLLRQVIATYETPKSPRSSDMLDLSAALKALADIRRHQTDHREAEPLLRRSLELAQHGGADSLEVAEIQMLLARVLTVANRNEEALALMETAVAAHHMALGNDHPRVAHASHEFGAVLLDSAHYEEARAPLRHAYELRQRYYGIDHPDTVSSLNNLAGVYAMTGLHHLALPLRVRVLEADRRHYEGDHPYVAEDWISLGFSHWQLGHAEAAVEHYNHGLAMQRRIFEPDNLILAINLDNLGLALTDTGRFEEAEAAHLDALEIRKRRKDPAEYWHRGDSLLNLVQLELARGRPQAAFDYLQKADLALDRELPLPDVWEKHRLKSLQGALRADLESNSDTLIEERLVDGFYGLLDTRGPRDRFTRDAAQRLTRWLARQGRGPEAEAVRQQIIAPEPLPEGTTPAISRAAEAPR